jgi:hypothetical protein
MIAWGYFLAVAPGRGQWHTQGMIEIKAEQRADGGPEI